MTHAALASTRVMATCSILGQAVGTAAATCARDCCEPRDLATGSRLHQLQQHLMEDDCWLPGLTRSIDTLTREAGRFHAEQGDTAKLIDGTDRDLDDAMHAWEAPIGTPVTLSFEQSAPGGVEVGSVRFAFDSNLANEKRMPFSYPQKGNRSLVPRELIRKFILEVQDAQGRWSPVHQEQENHQRLVTVPLGVVARAIRFTPLETWGAERVRVFALEASQRHKSRLPVIIQGPPWSQVVAQVPQADLLPPESGLEAFEGDLKHTA